MLDESGAETGMYTIPAGGRRFRALELLVKQKRMNKTALVPCFVRTDGLAEEDSLAENVQRAPLHPLDQFRAFQAMREKGRTEETRKAASYSKSALSRSTVLSAFCNKRPLPALRGRLSVCIESHRRDRSSRTTLFSATRPRPREEIAKFLCSDLSTTPQTSLTLCLALSRKPGVHTGSRGKGRCPVGGAEVRCWVMNPQAGAA